MLFVPCFSQTTRVWSDPVFLEKLDPDTDPVCLRGLIRIRSISNRIRNPAHDHPYSYTVVSWFNKEWTQFTNLYINLNMHTHTSIYLSNHRPLSLSLSLSLYLSIYLYIYLSLSRLRRVDLTQPNTGCPYQPCWTPSITDLENLKNQNHLQI